MDWIIPGWHLQYPQAKASIIWSIFWPSLGRQLAPQKLPEGLSSHADPWRYGALAGSALSSLLSSPGDCLVQALEQEAGSNPLGVCTGEVCSPPGTWSPFLGSLLKFFLTIAMFWSRCKDSLPSVASGPLHWAPPTGGGSPAAASASTMRHSPALSALQEFSLAAHRHCPLRLPSPYRQGWIQLCLRAQVSQPDALRAAAPA